LSDSDNEGVEVWRGGVAAWEADAMGHMNVAFYVSRISEGLAGMAAELGMGEAFTPAATATLAVREHHIRFRREARVAARLGMSCGVLDVGESDMRLLFLIRHHDGQLAASFNTVVAHVTAGDGRAFPWPQRVRERAENLKIALPAEAAPRSLTLEPVTVTASAQRARDLGMLRSGMGALKASDCDVFGRLAPESVMARISLAVPQLFGRVLGRLRKPDGKELGGAVVEYRMLHLEAPGPGRTYEIRSGFSGGDARVRQLTHWMLDRETGRPWAVARGVVVALDLQARTTATLDAAALASIQANMIEGLSY